MAEQNFANHVRWVPGFHYFVMPVMALNLGWSIYRLKAANFSLDSIIGVLVAAALVGLMLYARLFALAVQNRVIRLEERIRLERLLPDDLRPRIADFSCRQLIAMRFASDAELPALARKVLADNIQESKAIKQMVQNWRPDYLRA
jgi:cell division protein FtsL